MAVSPVVQNSLRQLFKRCVQCPNETPSCPACDDDEYCSQMLSSCTTCASAVCVKMDGSSSDGGAKGGPNVGAIAGGVVGGVAFVLILAFLIWRFYVKRRRDGEQSEQWSQIEHEKANNSDFAMQRDARASTHTVGSMASTVLTRASNIIQIAYIPGVTNRSAPQSPGHLAPPVPPIPAAHSQRTSPGSEEQHFFVPGDLRDSTYSGLSDPRTSYARSSVATTIYRDNAVVSPLPAQTIVRGKAAVVSVKSSNTSSPSPTPGSTTPPVPAIDYGKLEEEGKVQTPTPKSKFKIQMPHSSDGPSLRPGVSPSGSVRSFQIAKPKALNLVKGKTSNSSLLSSTSRGASDSISTASTPSKERSENSADRIPITLRPLTEVSVTDSIETAPEDPVSRISDDSSDDEPSTRHQGAYVSTHHKGSATSSSSGLQSPFADAQTGEENVDAKTKTKASEGDSGRARSPFGDEHAVKDD
ncbi:uncharacterized protein J3D65DRAFT_442205 [Phyllosticta citribraziliensis]|uniref:Membrane anchor Opy2 N-terminal domain-containing protein n=1 Tax=Phyllosticta citribraziliensis TaxID=989973 RepID=A0ABR1LKA1_9PEZI